MISSNMDFPTRNQGFFMVLRGCTGANGCFAFFGCCHFLLIEKFWVHVFWDDLVWILFGRKFLG